MPCIEPAAIDATCATGRTCDGLCARARDDKQRSTRPPTTTDAVILDPLLMSTPDGLTPGLSRGHGDYVLRRTDGEADFPRQRLVRDLVRHLDLEPIVALGERGQRHGLAALQLVAGREIELRRQRLSVQVLRIGFVEELLGCAALLLIKVVLDADVGLVVFVDLWV